MCNKTLNKEKINFSTTNDKIYLFEVGDLNASSIVLSTTNIVKKENNIVYNDEAIFYKKTKDTLIIYYRVSPDIPKNFQTKIIIKQKKLTNVEFYNFWENYNKKGLKKFPE